MNIIEKNCYISLRSLEISKINKLFTLGKEIYYEKANTYLGGMLPERKNTLSN